MSKNLELTKSFNDEGEHGFSLIELMVVVLIATIMAAAAVLSFSTPKKFAADDQTLKVLDVMQEARQRAINQKSMMRVEFNDTTKSVRIIDENLAANTADDLLIRSLEIDTSNVTLGTRPQNVSITNLPPAASPMPELVFASSNYPSSKNQNVFTFCFVKDGRIVQTDAAGLCNSSNTVRGATMYIYSKPDAAGLSSIIRAMTVSGLSSETLIYKCKTDSTKNCVSWINN